MRDEHEDGGGLKMGSSGRGACLLGIKRVRFLCSGQALLKLSSGI